VTRSSRLGDLTKDEFASAVEAGTWLLLPFGSVEAHGPHLGLGADTIDAAHVCRAVAERVGGLVAPTLPYGVCRTMRNLPGTVSLSATTLTAVVREVVGDYVRHGVRRLALYSGHAEPGQLEALREAVLPIVDAPPRPTVLVVGPYAFLDPVRQEAGLAGKDGHAASLETSTLLVLDPTVVRLDRVPAVAGRPPLSQLHVLARPEAEFPTGVRGDTTRISPELGRRALDHVVTEFARLLERVAREGREW
jgi:creatinine amidohydrolase